MPSFQYGPCGDGAILHSRLPSSSTVLLPSALRLHHRRHERGVPEDLLGDVAGAERRQRLVEVEVGSAGRRVLPQPFVPLGDGVDRSRAVCCRRRARQRRRAGCRSLPPCGCPIRRSAGRSAGRATWSRPWTATRRSCASRGRVRACRSPCGRRRGTPSISFTSLVKKSAMSS